MTYKIIFICLYDVYTMYDAAMAYLCVCIVIVKEQTERKEGKAEKGPDYIRLCILWLMWLIFYEHILLAKVERACVSAQADTTWTGPKFKHQSEKVILWMFALLEGSHKQERNQSIPSSRPNNEDNGGIS